MTEFLYNLSALFLFCTFLLSGAYKIIRQPEGIDTSNSNLLNKWLMRFAKSLPYAIIEILGAILLITTETIPTKVIVVGTMIVVALYGLYLEFALKTRCDCFEFAGVEEHHSSNILKSITLFCAIFMLIALLNNSSVPLNKTVLSLAFIISIAFSFRFINLRTEAKSTQNLTEASTAGSQVSTHSASTNTSKTNPSSQNNSAQTLTTLEETTYLGQAKDETLTMANVIKSDKPLLLVNVSSDCKHCAALVPDLLNFADAFQDKLTVAIVSNKAIPPSKSAIVIHDENKTLFKNINAQGMPFGLIFNKNSYSSLAPLMYGPAKIRMLFSLILNIATE